MHRSNDKCQSTLRNSPGAAYQSMHESFGKGQITAVTCRGGVKFSSYLIAQQHILSLVHCLMVPMSVQHS